MTRQEQKNLEDKQNEILQLRASFGKWSKDGIHITITDRNITPQEDLRGYHIKEERGAYIKPLEYDVTKRDMIAKVKTLQQMNFKLVAPQFPELMEFFRNGKPITEGDLVAEAIDEMKTVKDNRNGLEFLFDTY
jgi:hypothetical protein